jgi:hypothetical protein
VPNFSREPSRREPHDDGDPSPQSDDETPAGRRIGSLRRHKWLFSSLALLAVAIAFGGWLGAKALDAKSNLEQARGSAQQAKDALSEGKAEDATRWAADAHSHAQAARDATHSLPWRIAAAVPWLGSPFESGRQMTDVVLGLASDVLEPSAEIGTAMSPARLLEGGHLDVQLLRNEEPALSKVSADATRLDALADAIPDPGFVSVLRDARSKLQKQTSDLAKLLRNTALAARVAPSLMGADGPRTYFMGFQTNAEARGTGGLLGGFGILRLDDGVPTMDTLGPNNELDKPFTPIDLGPDYADQYGFANTTTDYRNSNLSPHFPYAAQIWMSMWAQQTGMNVDGAIAIDPVALSYVLGAVGPVTMPDGEVITADNVVELTESTAYIRFPADTDQPARKMYLQDIAKEVVKKMTGPVPSPRALLEALGKAVSEGRIAVWSASPADQKVLEETPLAHVVPDDAAPYAAVVINNLGGNKLDYYLKRGIEYAADNCDGKTRNSTVTIQLTSTVPAGLPDFLAGTSGLVGNAPISVPKGTMLTSVRLIATKGAVLKSAIANGQRVPIIRGTELGHPTFEIQVAIPPGKSGELTIHLSEPTSPGAPRVPVQPLVDTVTPVVSVPACPG